MAPGSIFVHVSAPTYSVVMYIELTFSALQRNVAQCFHEDDLSASAALTYAVNVLEVEAIIVCGASLLFVSRLHD